MEEVNRETIQCLSTKVHEQTKSIWPVPNISTSLKRLHEMSRLQVAKEYSE